MDTTYQGKTIAFIPVRGGSKTIPLKNIKFINGRPLIYWVLDATMKCKNIDNVIVSTDCEQIKKVALDYHSDKVDVLSRSAEVSTDEASTESVMLEFAKNYVFDNIILLQATSPLIKSNDLDAGIRKLSEGLFNSVLSLVRQKRFIWTEENGSLFPVNYNPLTRPRRQNFDGFLVENGAFYITSRDSLISSNCRVSGSIGYVEMSEDSYYEIDEPTDWIIVEELIKKHEELYNKIHNCNIKCVLSDCDGVLTDGGMYYSDLGDELKKFNTKDGMGFKLLNDAGLITGIITGEKIELVKKRAEKLKLDEIHTGIKNKMKIIDLICEKYGINYSEIAYIGDDINDTEVINKVGLGCAVNNATNSVKKVATIITKCNGGEGALRELAEIILKKKRGL